MNTFASIVELLAQNGPTMITTLVAVLVIYRAQARIERLADAMEEAMVKDAFQNYRQYGMLVLYFLGASLGAAGDVAEKMGWHATSACAKILQPGVIAVIAKINPPPPFTPPRLPTGNTNPPIPKP